MTAIRAALDFMTDLRRMPDVSGMAERLRAAVERFGVPTLSLGGDRRAVGARAMLVTWDRSRLADLSDASVSGRGGAVAETSVTPLRRPASGGRLRTAIVPLDGVELDETERAMLRLVGDVIEEQIEAGVDRPIGRAERPVLSPRERECLQWTAGGKTTWEISAILEISQNTIDGYIASATRKLGAVNRTQAVAEALRRGLID